MRKFFTILAADVGSEAYSDEYVAWLRDRCEEYRQALEFIAKQEDHAGNWAVEKARTTLRANAQLDRQEEVR